ncbi:hypothetical protein PENSOL_c080G08371 [Penicillium solitum]|uniref:Uncharacterized protein n=1 Tax=Penicillium solitum TaxID=60172 RepID=A0A1V6QDQ0_9EURO|nr:uncharacterized protein PENSOL_c080G08371 [Penicillium solitum]OQD87340.1 hypothetical protein PENSOL_c080G08371 [Penicillium solitum]
MSCHVNCSERPPQLSPDNDITGPGVITNYVGSAGLAVFLILVYFFMVYDPARDPFDNHEMSQRPYQANPIDEMVTRKVRSCFKWSLVAIGDLQLITGFSILIGGAIQLDCGLTVYEWQVIVRLAWFSCLTHLSCLMALRNYLHTHTFGRTWRLVAMGILASMLIVGLLPTANYIDLLHSISSEYAMCHLAIRPSSGIALWSMVLPILVIALSFVSRVIKLHKTLSVELWGKLRTRASVNARSILLVVYNRCSTRGLKQRLSFFLVYRPLFAAFFVARLVFAAWSSMFVEGLWLLIAFIWGLLQLMGALNDGSKELGLWTMPGSHTRTDWTFGQVVSLLLLAAPLISLLEYLDHSP